jgi:hypothetical protein
MRAKNLFAVMGVISIVLIYSLGAMANALPDLSIWNGKWFKVTSTGRGYVFEGSGFGPGRWRDVIYLYFHDWNAHGGQADAWELDEGSGQWVNDPAAIVDIHFHGGAGLDFLCYIFIENVDTTTAMTLRVTGKEDKRNPGQLKGATLKSLGGCSWESDGGEYFAGGQSVKGKMVPISNLPFPWP